MQTNLEQEVEKRRQQAIERKIPEKAEFVAKTAGTQKRGSYKFSDNRLVIELIPRFYFSEDPFGGDLSHEYYQLRVSEKTGLLSRRTIFSAKTENGKQEIEAYVPGEWEKQFDALYQKVSGDEARRKQEETDEMKRNIEASLKQNFGL